MSSGNNGFVKDIKIERIDDVSVLSTFYCGNGEMDDFIQAKENGLESFMKSKTDISAYVAKIEHDVVAFFSIRESTLELDEDDKEDMVMGISSKPDIAYKNPSYLSEKVFKALEISYFAVHKDKQKQGIGFALLNVIKEYAIRKIEDCQFIMVGAYHSHDYSAVDFYSKFGFTKHTPTPIEDVWPMYYVIYPHYQE